MCQKRSSPVCMAMNKLPSHPLVFILTPSRRSTLICIYHPDPIPSSYIINYMTYYCFRMPVFLSGYAPGCLYQIYSLQSCHLLVPVPLQAVLIRKSSIPNREQFIYSRAIITPFRETPIRLLLCLPALRLLLQVKQSALQLLLLRMVL